MEVLHPFDAFLVEVLGVGRSVEIEVSCLGSAVTMKDSLGEPTAEDLVRPLTAQHHLHTHGLDFPAQQVHGRARPHRRDVVGLQVIDDLWNGVQSLL